MRGRQTVFLDRDGVINRERGEHTWRLEDFEILPEVAEAIRTINASGRLVIVISNQSGIGLGLHGKSEVERLHDYLHAQLAAQGAAIDAVYYCPHHPTQGRCLCRKPGSLLLERAIARHGIDANSSVMIGDRERDIEAAAAVGVKGILVEPNASLLRTMRQNDIV
jgi:D-glycero-D-manno-heptose 1,7-bisphosphate phosphatase